MHDQATPTHSDVDSLYPGYTYDCSSPAVLIIGIFLGSTGLSLRCKQTLVYFCLFRALYYTLHSTMLNDSVPAGNSYSEKVCRVWRQVILCSWGKKVLPYGISCKTLLHLWIVAAVEVWFFSVSLMLKALFAPHHPLGQCGESFSVWVVLHLKSEVVV